MKIKRENSLRKIISLFMLTALSLFISPKELIHEFLNHHDTADFTCTDSCKDHVSDLHQHCDVLQLSSPPLYHHVGIFLIKFISLPFYYNEKNTTSYYSPFAFSFYLRGPPSLT